MYKCHNCSVALPFAALLKRVNRSLHDEFMFERMKEGLDRRTRRNVTTTFPDQRARHQNFNTGTTQLWQVAHHPGHPVYNFCIDRKLPAAALTRLFFSDDAHTWLASQGIPDEKNTVNDGVSFLVQPFTMPDGRWYGAQLRRVDKKEFFTFRWAEDPLKVFGLDNWDPSQLTYMVEGPIDSLFLPNCLAAAGSDLLDSMHLLDQHGLLPPHTPIVYVWDNEPRNKEITRHLRNAIRLHESVVVWTNGFPHKDINDAVKAGVDVVSIVAKRTFSGITADMEFQQWLKNYRT